MLATTSTAPLLMSPPVNFSKASCAMLKPATAASMAVMLIVAPVAGFVKFQHPPQLGEFHTTSKAPPMNGNEGTSPNVGNRAASPLAPLEHATLFSELFLLSYAASYVTRTGDALGFGGRGVDVGGFGDELGV